MLDLIVIGEGEEVDLEILKLKAKAKEEGWTKLELLEKCSKLKGVYCPLLHKEGETVKKAIVEDFENAPYPTSLLVPNINIVHDRAVMELYRGCASGCRFCQAGFYYRPIRERSAKRIAALAEKIIDSTGYEELSLCSLSTGDYSYLKELIGYLKKMSDAKHVDLSLPSLAVAQAQQFRGRQCSEFSKKFADVCSRGGHAKAKRRHKQKHNGRRYRQYRNGVRCGIYVGKTVFYDGASHRNV